MDINQYSGKSLSYKGYQQLVNKVVEEGKTTGPVQSEALSHYTVLNAKRMSRLEKTVILDPTIELGLKNLPVALTAWVLTEAWCGDAAQSLPVLQKMAEASQGKLELRLLLRDENLDLMDQYLTNGGRSIPKVLLYADEQELGTWGPRPVDAQKLVNELKTKETPQSEAIAQVQVWYNKNKGKAVQEEIWQVIQSGLK